MSVPLLCPTKTPDRAADFACRLAGLADEQRDAGVDVDTPQWYRRLIDAATRRMAHVRGVDAAGLVDDDAPGPLDEALADWPSNLWDDPHALGWLHEQFAATARHDAFEAHVQREKKHATSTTTTQLYTPRWVADVLAREAIGRAGVDAPEVVDPAVGGGQMLLAAMAQFAQRFPDASPQRWVEPLWGVDLDERAVEVTRRTLALEVARRTGDRCPRAESLVDARITAGDGLSDDDVQPRQVVLTNPPYMGWRSMPDELRERLDPRFRPYHHDLFSTFILRCHQLARRTVGILAQQSIWYLRRFEKARRDLLERGDLTLFVHLGPGAFWNLAGEKASVVAFVQTSGDNDVRESTRLWDLRSQSGPEAKREAFEQNLDATGSSDCARLFDVETIRSVPGRPICHDLNSALRMLFETLPSLSQLADVPSQNKTGRNRQYVRRWNAVNPDELHRVDALGGRGGAEGRWVFYSKGGKFAPWWGNWQWVVDWSESAREFYDDNRTSRLLEREWWFRQGIVYTDFAGRRFNARWMPPNCLFDMTGPAIFPGDHWWPTLDERERIGAALAVLNSSPARRMLRALNPTLHFQMRDVRALPIPDIAADEATEIAGQVWELVDGLRRLHAGVEADPLYDPAVQMTAEDRRGIVERLAKLEAQVDRRICEAYGVGYCPIEEASINQHNVV